VNDHDRLAGIFKKTFGLSEAQAEAAARGRDGSSAPSFGASGPVAEDESRRVVESEAEWQARMQRELAELARGIAEVDAMQRELYPKLIMEDIARIQAQERRRIQADDRRSSGRRSVSEG
jgi:hypothetical protein